MAGSETSPSRVKVVCARISNFRALQNIELQLGDLTVMVGPNNAGKTSILEGIQAAIGATRKMLSKDDIFLSAAEIDVPKDRIRVRPAACCVTWAKQSKSNANW